ncbi:DUF3817 domain-containing protein [Reinekea marina]|uniref:DUF3817 domain-containing protein n=1 Tax=Reinekea marina TaxID=1310421 RepID=A0ABV7WQT2_9GAMM|nr:DUF3817 domain-containing protein [Reinekea marina]MDN3647861.1 DUF3817 domain-containing protein [Reinekea marina]
MLKAFRAISVLEGLSYLVILGVTFGFISREWVMVLGLTHGALFTLYFVASLIVTHKMAWPVWGWLLLLLVSIVPFAFIALEWFLRQREHKLASTVKP